MNALGRESFVKNDSDLLYLLRNGENIKVAISNAFKSDGGVATGTRVDRLKQEAEETRDALLRDINALQGSIDAINVTLNGDVTSQTPGLGELIIEIRATLEATALRVTEVFDYAEELKTESASFQRNIEGQIIRGWVTDPTKDDPVFGIAIAENLNYSATAEDTITKETIDYYKLDSKQSFGLYTATGWQFWLNGKKVGWFDSADGMLHVTSITIEDDLYLGSGWVMTKANGFGLRYLGA